ncbi:DUF2493 domain-containing protein [Novosphingobium sp. NPDC080210]|uniref:DUF2493 domain-containing protein n=1 Tax=Novosphingobium sp. NPDC080210 TaxID=3390596 RepID=UPI003D05220C
MIIRACPRVLVYGGRDFNDADHVGFILDVIRKRYGIAVVIEGEAPGADTLARDWAQLMNIPVEPYFAEWQLFGPRAGTIRNARMLREGKPDLAVGFPGGRGTADMTRRLAEARVPTMLGCYAGEQVRWTLKQNNSLAPAVHVK